MKRYIFYLFIIILFNSCSKPKTVFICGDHICVNKTEARQYFEENLTIEVKVIKNKKEKIPSLIELNMTERNKKKQVSLLPKNETDQSLRTLSKKEIREIKSNIKDRSNLKKSVKINQDYEKKKNSLVKLQNKKIIEKKIINNDQTLVDICTILKECSIDEISKYLINEGNKKKFPDITSRY